MPGRITFNPPPRDQMEPNSGDSTEFGDSFKSVLTSLNTMFTELFGGTGTVAGDKTYTGSALWTAATKFFGYGTGAGGAVTQATDRTTGVTLSKPTGKITTNTASLAAGATAKFTVTNTLVAATDTILLSLASGSSTDQTDVKVQRVAAGAFDIVVANRDSVTAETGAMVINFALIKAVAA